MASINVNANISAPSEITIPLVRADYHETSNVFRVFFEIFMSLFSGLLGYILSLTTPQPIHYVSLTITGLGAISFLATTFFFAQKSRQGLTHN